jgi:hypothetical protein
MIYSNTEVIAQKLTHPGTFAMLGEMMNVIFILTVLLVEPKSEAEACPI